ncbi:MAG: sugar transferase [Planctomycetes bacterium]|nr:sugar transferase [Planctomycetota bacterium]
MKILFLAQRVPFPPNRGDKITTWRLVERLARKHEVTIVAFAHDKADMQGAAALKAKGFETIAVPLDVRQQKIRALPKIFAQTPMTLAVFGSKQMQCEVDRHMQEVDAAYAYSSSMGAFLLQQDKPWVMHFAELDSDKWLQYADRHRWPLSAIYKREWRLLEKFEAKVADATTQNVFCTPLEEQIFQDRIPGRNSMVLRNGVDLQHFSPRPSEAQPEHMVFTGVMDYYPNIDGCKHFVREVLPRVRSEFPNARLSIVGSRPTKEVLRLGKADGIEVTGFVDSTADWMAQATIGVAPLRVARGIQNKVLEAMAMGLPVVGTTSATQGVGAVHGRHYLVADRAEEQGHAIRGLLRDQAVRERVGQAARNFVEQNHDWESVFAPLDDLF